MMSRSENDADRRPTPPTATSSGPTTTPETPQAKSEARAGDPRMPSGEAAAAAEDVAGAQGAGRAGTVVRTLVALAITGVGVSGWILYYTDWFPVFSGLVTLGGAFAWIGFVSGLLSKERKEQLQRSFEQRFLARRGAWLGIFAVGFFLLLSTSLLGGTVVVQSFDDLEHRALTLQPLAAKGWLAERLTVREALPPRSTRKYFLWHFFQYRDYRLKLSGLPALQVRPSLLRRHLQISPGDFYLRPVVLARPTYALSQVAAGAGLRLSVYRDGDDEGQPLAEFAPYSGKAIWLGGDTDLALPEGLRQRWRQELLRQVDEKAEVLWLPAQAPPFEVPIEAGDVLRIRLATRSGKSYGGEVVYTVLHVTGATDFPQEVILDVPHAE